MSTFGVVDLFCPFCGKEFRYDQTKIKGYFHSSEWGVLCSKACFDAGQRAYGRMIIGQDTLHQGGFMKAEFKIGETVVGFEVDSMVPMETIVTTRKCPKSPVLTYTLQLLRIDKEREVAVYQPVYAENPMVADYRDAG